jgi:hypothetical protein
MAQDVHSTLVQIMGQHLGGREEHGLEYLRAMRASRRYQVRRDPCNPIIHVVVRVLTDKFGLDRRILGEPNPNFGGQGAIEA